MFSNVILGNQILSNWKITSFPLNETSWLSHIVPVKNVQLPAFYRTQFSLPKKYTKCLDTYLDTSGWTKVRSKVIHYHEIFILYWYNYEFV